MISHTTVLLVTNYLALVTSVWLGWYVVTRSPRNLLSWLTGLTLWSVGGLFLNTILALYPPPSPASSPEWLRLFFPFWPEEAFETGWAGWLQGWQVVPAIIFWHHATMILRPGRMNKWRWTRVIAGYVVAVIGIWLLIDEPLIFADMSGSPLFLDTLKPGPLYFPFLFGLLLFTFFCLVNILRTMRVNQAEVLRRQLMAMAIATLFAGFTVPAALVAAVFEIPVPRLIYTILLLIGIVLIGYGVARYSALMDGRTIRRDFVYSAIAMALVIEIYAIVTWVSVKLFRIPPAAFVFVFILVIITHNLVDVTRHKLDSLFFQRENRQIRANLRKLANQIGEKDFDENISFALDSICSSVRATFGLVVIFENDHLKTMASINFQSHDLSCPISDFSADDIIHLDPHYFPPPLENAALLIPLYFDTTQIGALLLGRPENGTNFSNEDMELLLYPSDRLSEIIYSAQRESEYLKQLSQFAEKKTNQEKISSKDVEVALRNLHDFTLLSDLSLANLKLVQTKLSPSEVTHIERGKAVHHVISEAMDKLRPDAVIPRDPPPREWHAYIILHDAYQDDKLNRDIMSKLYISEGTFNRTRRAAIRTVARVLEEMEITYH